MSNVVDGSKSIDSYGEFGRDGNTASSYLEVDLEEVKSISKINLYRYFSDGRTYDGTVIALSKKADFSEKTIVYNSDKANFHGLGAGEDNTYAESAEGKSITLEDAVEARYVRVYMHGQNATATTNHVVELEVIGNESMGPADYTIVDEALSIAGSYDKSRDDYLGFDKLDAAVAAVVEGYDASRQLEVNNMARDIFKAVAALEKTNVKKDAASAVEQAAAYQDSSKYTAESWAVFQKALKELKDVLANNASTKEDYDGALKALNEAISKLTPVSNNLVVTPPEETKIQENGIYENGNYKYKVTSLSKKTVEVAGTTNPKLKKVKIGNTVKLGEENFKITSIQASAFKNNKNITSVSIGKNVAKIGDSAFEKCSKLTKVTVNGNSLTQIGKKAFMNCKKLKNVTVKSKKVKKIGKNAFKGIHKKAKVKIPKKKK